MEAHTEQKVPPSVLIRTSLSLISLLLPAWLWPLFDVFANIRKKTHNHSHGVPVKLCADIETLFYPHLNIPTKRIEIEHNFLPMGMGFQFFGALTDSNFLGVGAVDNTGQRLGK